MRGSALLYDNPGRKTDDVTPVGPYMVPKDTIIMISFHAIQANSRLWDDAETFRPERWETDDGYFYERKDRPAVTFKPDAALHGKEKQQSAFAKNSPLMGAMEEVKAACKAAGKKLWEYAATPSRSKIGLPGACAAAAAAAGLSGVAAAAVVVGATAAALIAGAATAGAAAAAVAAGVATAGAATAGAAALAVTAGAVTAGAVAAAITAAATTAGAFAAALAAGTATAGATAAALAAGAFAAQSARSRVAKVASIPRRAASLDSGKAAKGQKLPAPAALAMARQKSSPAASPVRAGNVRARKVDARLDAPVAAERAGMGSKCDSSSSIASSGMSSAASSLSGSPTKASPVALQLPASSVKPAANHAPESIQEEDGTAAPARSSAEGAGAVETRLQRHKKFLPFSDGPRRCIGQVSAVTLLCWTCLVLMTDREAIKGSRAGRHYLMDRWRCHVSSTAACKRIALLRCFISRLYTT